MIRYHNPAMHLYNIHTHSSNASDPDVREIVNCIIEKQKDFSLDTRILYSVGIHPWYIFDNVKEQLSALKSLATQSNVIAIGEAGLDKLSKVQFDIQQSVFKESAIIAEEQRKPLIIHCVKAWAEIIGEKKRLKPNSPWIIHGFRGNSALAGQLLDQGLYLSFGKQFQTEALHKAWKEFRLFAETDDKETEIRTVYQHIATTLTIPIEDLATQIEKNIKDIFPSLIQKY
jgi:TatD DNase family protein